MQTLGVPYEEGYDKKAKADAEAQALEIAKDIVNNMPAAVKKGINVEAKINELKKKEIVALIAYLQRLGTDIKGEKVVEKAAPTNTTDSLNIEK